MLVSKKGKWGKTQELYYSPVEVVDGKHVTLFKKVLDVGEEKTVTGFTWSRTGKEFVVISNNRMLYQFDIENLKKKLL
ncbi:MAG: hypothetical protein OCD01_00730 [Fibrobacterales bacterium]